MPPRNPELPEGTDHIINGAMETGAGTGASTGSSGGIGEGTGGLGGSSSGFIGAGATASLGDDTGGTTTGSGGGFGGSGGSSGGSGGSFGSGDGQVPIQQLKSGAQSLRQQATGKVREYAEDGKSRATTALDDFSTVVRDAADQIDERLGSEYGQYARRAAEAVSDFSQTLRNKEVDELYDNAREVVRKSPVVAIGAAAAVGFALVRLIKAGVPDQGERDVEFTPDQSLGGTGGTTSQAPYVAPTTGV
jgi:ElaB/YqjD/DUF883 family membrane-anchored ribosome-binding protein